MVRATAMVAALALGSGCYYSTEDSSGAAPAAAEATAWASFGLGGDPPPVEYVSGAALDCDDGTGFSYWMPAQRMYWCLRGVTETTGVVRVALVPDRRQVVDTLCHEFTHEFLWRSTGDSDFYHLNAAWSAGGAHERCDQATP